LGRAGDADRLRTGRGVVYALVGGLAALAAWRGGQAEGTKGALATLQDDTWGLATLAVVAIGMLAFAAWRVIDSCLDLDDHGADARGIVARIALLVSGAVHLSLAVYTATLLSGGGSAQSDGEGTQGITRALLQQPFGRWLVAGVGLCVIGAGVYLFHKAWKRTYRDRIRVTAATERLDPFMRAGIVAHGVVIALIGGFTVWAAWTYDPEKAGGMSQAFAALRSAPFGRILLGLVAVGLVFFAALCFVNAIYRIVPRRAGRDVATLASAAAAQAERAGREIRAALR
jgi:Domain of Unknown Function (DUF1206)